MPRISHSNLKNPAQHTSTAPVPIANFSPEGKPLAPFLRTVPGKYALGKEGLRQICQSTFSGNLENMAKGLGLSKPELERRLSGNAPIESALEHRINVGFFGKKYPGFALHPGNPSGYKPYTTYRIGEASHGLDPYLGVVLPTEYETIDSYSRKRKPNLTIDTKIIKRKKVGGEPATVASKTNGTELSKRSDRIRHLADFSDQAKMFHPNCEQFLPVRHVQSSQPNLAQKGIEEGFHDFIYQEWLKDPKANDPNQVEFGGIGYSHTDPNTGAVTTHWLWRGRGGARSVDVPNPEFPPEAFRGTIFVIHNHPRIGIMRGFSMTDFNTAARLEMQHTAQALQMNHRDLGDFKFECYVTTGTTLLKAHTDELEFTRISEERTPRLVDDTRPFLDPEWKLPPGPFIAHLTGGDSLHKYGVATARGGFYPLHPQSGLYRSRDDGSFFFLPKLAGETFHMPEGVTNIKSLEEGWSKIEAPPNHPLNGLVLDANGILVHDDVGPNKEFLEKYGAP